MLGSIFSLTDPTFGIAVNMKSGLLVVLNSGSDSTISLPVVFNVVGAVSGKVTSKIIHYKPLIGRQQTTLISDSKSLV